MKRKLIATLVAAILAGPTIAAAQDSDNQSQGAAESQQQTGNQQGSEPATNGATQSSNDQQSQDTQEGASEPASGTEPGQPSQQEQTQSQTGTQGQSAAGTQASGNAVISEQSPDQMLVENLYDASVVNTSGEDIGSINDVLLSNDGRVAGIIVGVGGFLGMGEKNVGLSWDQLQYNAAEQTVTTDIAKAQLEAAPAFMSQQQKQQAEQQQQQEQLQQQQEQQQQTQE